MFGNKEKKKEDKQKKKELEKQKKEEQKEQKKALEEFKKKAKKDKESLEYHLVQFLKILNQLFYQPTDKWYVILIIVIMGVLMGMVFGLIVGVFLKGTLHIAPATQNTITKTVTETVI